MDTGENSQGLRAVIDLLRKASIVLLLLHFFIHLYSAWEHWGLTTKLITRILLGFGKFSLFDSFLIIKAASLGMLCLSAIGTKGKKEEKITGSQVAVYILAGVTLYFGSVALLYVNLDIREAAIGYIAITSLGFLLTLTGLAKLSRLIKVKLTKDIFNEDNETFPQEERLLENEYSINLPGIYRYKGKARRMYLNLINCARMVMVCGSPGAGKSFFLVREFIRQTIAKSHCVVLYDFKYEDLSIIAYNTWLQYRNNYPVPPKFFIINFDNPIDRCNPLEPSTLLDITDATESSRTILLGLNMEWIKKSGGDRAIFY